MGLVSFIADFNPFVGIQVAISNSRMYMFTECSRWGEIAADRHLIILTQWVNALLMRLRMTFWEVLLVSEDAIGRILSNCRVGEIGKAWWLPGSIKTLGDCITRQLSSENTRLVDATPPFIQMTWNYYEKVSLSNGMGTESIKSTCQIIILPCGDWSSYSVVSGQGDSKVDVPAGRIDPSVQIADSCPKKPTLLWDVFQVFIWPLHEIWG